MKTRLFLCSTLTLITASHLEAADVTGTWKAEFDTQIGLQKYTYTLKQDGEKVTGKASSDIGGEKREAELKDGKLAGDEIKFTRNVGEFVTEELVAKRVMEAGAGGAAGFNAAKLEGTWTYASGERDGNKVAKENLAGAQVTITDKEIKLGGPGGDFTFVYKLDTTRQPVAVKLEMTAGIAVGSTTDGIIGFDGEQLKLCYAAMGGPAPAKFEAPAGSGSHLFVLEKVAAK